MNSSSYTWLMLAGIFVTLFTWSRIAKRDQRLLFIYVGALLGAFVGAKIIYLLAEGWLHFGKPDMWLQLATGKSILGALLGGYGGVELGKKMGGHSGGTRGLVPWVAPVCIIFRPV